MGPFDGGLGVFRDRAAIREFMEDCFRSYDRIEIDLEDVVQLGSEVVFNLAVQTGRLAGGDGEITPRYGTVVVWADGLIESVTNYLDIDEARAAAKRLAGRIPRWQLCCDRTEALKVVGMEE